MILKFIVSGYTHDLLKIGCKNGVKTVKSTCKVHSKHTMFLCNNDHHVSRRHLISLLVKSLCFGVFFKPEESVIAAVPTYEDYVGEGGGAVKKSGGSFIFDGKANKKSVSTVQNGLEVEIESKNELKSLLERGEVELNENIKTLIGDKQWEEIRKAIRNGVLYKIMKLTKDRNGNLLQIGLKSDQISSLNELAAVILAIDDFALQNRVVYFNGADKRAIQELKTNQDTQQDPIDLSEPFDNLALSIELIQALTSSLQQ